MIRTFKTHEVRMQEELTGSLWEFEPCEYGVKFMRNERNMLMINCIGE